MRSSHPQALAARAMTEGAAVALAHDVPKNSKTAGPLCVFDSRLVSRGFGLRAELWI